MNRIAAVLLTLSLLACQNKNASTDVKQVVEQEMSSASQILQQERATTEKMHAITDKVESLPEKFKVDQAEAYQRITKRANDINIKRDHCLNMLQESIGQSEQMLKATTTDIKQQFESEVQPKLKDASASVKRYNEALEKINVQLDSIAKVYGGN